MMIKKYHFKIQARLYTSIALILSLGIDTQAFQCIGVFGKPPSRLPLTSNQSYSSYAVGSIYLYHSVVKETKMLYYHS